MPAITAPAVAAVELFGGLALVAGLFTRLAASGIAVVMLGAMLIVHLPAGFFVPDDVRDLFAIRRPRCPRILDSVKRQADDV